MGIQWEQMEAQKELAKAEAAKTNAEAAKLMTTDTEKVKSETDIDNFRSLLYYYGLLTMCGTRGDRLRMCIPNNCVRERYSVFLREVGRSIT